MQTGSPIAVLGAGSWGTALAIQFARSGKATRLWGRDREQVAQMIRERANRRYLPSGAFPDSLSVGADLAAQLAGALDVLVVVPSDSFRAALAQDLSSANFRAYTSTDIVGVEVGGAVKNVLALAAGLSDGLGDRKSVV